MKKLICIAILLITFCTTAFSQFQGWNTPTGRNYYQDSMANKKLKNNAAGDSILSTDVFGKFKNILKGNSSTTVYYGIDTIIYDSSTHTICARSYGIFNCFVIEGHAASGGGVDSIVVGNQYCVWVGGIATCYGINTTINNNNYITQQITNIVDSSININNYYNGINCQNRLVSGAVILVGGFTFQNTDLIIEVGCRQYNVDASLFSIPSAAAADFFVKVYADTNNNVGYIVGPSLPAGIPALTDPGSQVEIATYLVKVGSTTPVGLGTYSIYFEGIEWVFSSNIVGADYLYPTNPYGGSTVSLYVPATTTAYAKGFHFDGDTIPVVDLTYFNFQIRLADTLDADDVISVGFRYGASYVSGGVSLKRGFYGLNGDKIDEWQTVAMPKNLFQFQLGQPVLDGVTFIYGGSLPDIQFDNIQWQIGGANTGGPVVIPPLVDSGRVTSDTAYYEYIDSRSGTVLFRLPTFVLHVYYDSCFIVDTVGRNVYISFNQNCGGSGSGVSGIVELGVSATLDKFNDSTYELKTVNSNVGSFTNANITVDAKGRVIAASDGTNGNDSAYVRMRLAEDSSYVVFDHTSAGGIPPDTLRIFGSGVPATGTTYTAGENVDISGDVISARDSSAYISFSLAARGTDSTDWIFHRRNNVDDTMSLSKRGIDSIRRVALNWQYYRNGSWITFGTDSTGGGAGGGQADSAYFWQLTGNAPAYGKFIGTTNNRSLLIKTNNITRISVDSATGNAALSANLETVGKVGVAGAVDATYNLKVYGANGIYSLGSGSGVSYLAGANSAFRWVGDGYLDAGSSLTNSLFVRGTSMILSSTLLTGAAKWSNTRDIDAAMNGGAAVGFGYKLNDYYILQQTLDSSRLVINNNTKFLGIGIKANNTVIGEALNYTTYTLKPSALLELNSTTRGFMPPVMTATQGSAISSPAEGLMIYVSDTNGTFTAKGWWGYDGSAWQKLNN